MTKLALGMIETIGLAAAIEAGDTAVKSANVKLIGYELSKGGGMVTVKFEGHVGAVKAAVYAGCMAAEKVSQVWSKQVIPRPHREIEKLIITQETVGLEKTLKKELPTEIEKIDDGIQRDGVKEDSKKDEEDNPLEELEPKEAPEVGPNEEEIEERVQEIEEEVEKTDKKPEDICNLCGDPKCPRKKGESRKDCIHYEK